MRYGVISDIHSNLAALRAVLADMPSVDLICCLGDIVGYGPNPNECVEALRPIAKLCVVGNHELVCLEGLPVSAFNEDAARASEWTRAQLSDASVKFLASLPTTIQDDTITLVHGSPSDPVWEYIHSASCAARNFRQFQTPYCLVGHTHVPVVFREQGGRVDTMSPHVSQPLDLSDVAESRYIINPGSVGQPRDRNPQASYAVLDTTSGRLQHYRVPYPIEETQNRMLAAGLPARLIVRLEYGW